jgi:hypothetical protein
MTSLGRKNERLIDCSNYNSALESISGVFNVRDERLLGAINSIEDYDNELVDKDYVYLQVCNQLGCPSPGFKAVWFHGTRSYDKCSFLKDGILPKSQAKSLIVKMLRQLAHGVESSGDYPHSLSVAFKQSERDEGPFAFLVRDAAVYAPGSAHNYTQRPELVEDLAGAMLRGNYELLVERFCRETKPYVIAFIGEADVFELMHAVWYLYLICQNVNISEEGGVERCCFSAGGNAVSPLDILRIEDI